LFIVVLWQQAVDGEGGSLAVAWWFVCLVHRSGRNRSFDPASTRSGGQAGRLIPRSGHIGAKRKGPQLALEPLNGRGIAGYVPKP
jgi:hypothetical protein